MLAPNTTGTQDPSTPPVDGTLVPKLSPPGVPGPCPDCGGTGQVLHYDFGRIRWAWVGKWWKPWTWDKYAWVYDSAAPKWTGHKRMEAPL